MLNQRDILLIPVPFTDLSTNRKRPVVVVSNDAYHVSTADMVVVAMTSNLTPSPYSFVITQNDLDAGALNKPSRVRADKIYTLSQKLSIKVFGRVKESVLEQIRGHLDKLIE